MSAFVVHRNGERYSVVTALGILCHHASRADALAAIEATGFADGEALLRNPSPPEVFKATWANAVAAELESVNAAIAELPSTVEVADLSDRLTVAMDSIAALQAAAERDRKRAELAALEQQVSPAVQNFLAALWPLDSQAKFRSRDHAMAVAAVWSGPIGQRIRELRASI